MKTLRRLVFVLTVCAASPALADIIVSPSLLNVSVGQNFSVNINISGASDLYGYQFDIGFDPTLLSATSVNEGGFLASAGSTFFFSGFIDNSGGTVTFIADSLLGPISGANGNGTLATIDFSALAAGSSTVGLFNVSAFNSFGEGIAVSTSGSTVNIGASSPVPEPSGLVLLFSVLLVFGMGCRRTRYRHT